MGEAEEVAWLAGGCLSADPTVPSGACLFGWAGVHEPQVHTEPLAESHCFMLRFCWASFH